MGVSSADQRDIIAPHILGATLAASEQLQSRATTMMILATFARYEIGALVTAFAAVVIYQFLTGRVNTRGLLSEKTSSGLGPVSPARVQLFLFTLAMAFYILSQVIKSHKFPEIDTKWLLILGGSHSVFLGAKGVLSLLSSGPK